MGASWAEGTDSIIKRSLLRELALIDRKLKLVDGEIKELERRYKMDSEEFKDLFDAGKLGEDQNCFEWWGLIRGRKSTARRDGQDKSGAGVVMSRL